MLALLLLLHNVAGKEVQKDVLTTQNITSCPDTGYFFKRDVINTDVKRSIALPMPSNANATDPGPCNLCFCQDNTTSVCWLRDSKKCDPKAYNFTDPKKRADRNRRSPGFTDIFFRDAAREVFDRQTPQQCKPFESSVSEGCPPVDWCIGCTVCDCDANGRWDCHTLSFCPDKKGKKQVRKRRNFQKSRIVKTQLAKKKSIPKTTKRPNKKPTKKNNKKPITGKKPQNNKYKSKQNNSKKINKKGNTKKISPVKNPKKTYHKKKVPPKMKGSNKNVKKGKKPIKINSKKGQTKKGKPLDKHETYLFTKKMLKKVMASVDKIVNESKNKIKRSMAKPINNKNRKNQSKGVKKVKTWQPVKKVSSNKKQRRFRRKRQIFKNSEDHFEKENITDFLPKIENIVFSPSIKYINETLKNERSLSSDKNKYFVYNVDSEHDNYTKEKNISENLYTKTQMSLKSNDLKTIHENNITLTESTVSESGYNRTRSTLILDISEIVNASLFKNSTNNTSYKKNKRCGSICQLKKASKMLFGNIDRRTVRKKKENAKNKNIMTYFKNVFRRLFPSNKKKTAPVIKKPVYRKRNIIKNLCKDISPCNYDPLDKTLQSKLNKLRMESNKILKSVRIIKGLLKYFGKELIVIKNISSIDNNQNNKDILILNAILKDGQNLASTFKNLTESQLRQMDYLKDNTKMFIQSIENFAINLNDIMKLLKKNNKQRISRRTLRCTKKYHYESIRNSTVSEKIKKLKNLLIKYNLVQNKFMKGMFDVLVTLDQETKPDIKKLAKVSDDIAKYNDSLVIDNYTKNIINNLRKLQNLAKRLSFKNRMKRAAMGDNDAIDYFLVLLEYLLKQNRPLDVSPVSDGIDILIEAIQNSPDLKSNEKIDLDSAPFQITKTDVITPESPLVPPYHSKNKIKENNITLKANKVIKEFESVDEESKGANMYDYADKYYKKTHSDYQKKIFDEKSAMNNLDLTTLIPKVYMAKDDDEKINSILGRFENEKNDDKRGYEVFVDDTDEDDVIIVTSTQSSEIDTEVDMPVTQNSPRRTTFLPEENEIILKKSLNSLKAIKKTNFEWMEENLSHEENRRDVLDIKETTTQIATQRATRTLKKIVSRYSNPVSSMSRETEDERQGKTMNPEYLMYKKQMNLLNSLDYETEKSALDSDSKEEKYNTDSFPYM